MIASARVGYSNRVGGWLIGLLFMITGCTAGPVADAGNRSGQIIDTPAETAEVIPELVPVELAADEKLRVVATTNLVADIVAQIGGEHISLQPLMAAGIDPHSYTTNPQDVRALTDADVIFINGVHLEEALDELFDTLAAPVVPVSVGVTLRELTDGEHAEAHEEEHADDHAAEHHHAGADPHTWQSVANVKVWVENIRTSLSQLDPAHAADYQAAADAYQMQLDKLDAEVRAKVATIPVDARKLVTDHDTFGYFAHEYNFMIIGALIPALSTTAQPSAQSLAALQDQIAHEAVQAIFVGTTVNPRLAEQLAQDLGIQVVGLYSDSLSAADGPASTYLSFIRYNVDAIVRALQ